MRILVLIVAIATAVACGKSEEQKRMEQAAEEMKKAAEAVADAAAKQGAATATQATNDMAKAMQGMAAALSGASAGPDGKPVQPISFKVLQNHVPTVSGWERGEVEGESMTSPVAYSQVETDYRKDKARVDVKIVDTGFAQMLVMPWSMMLASGYSRESTNGYEKATTVAGNPAVEKWDSRGNRGELNILVGKRFMVTVEGRNVADIKDVHAFASAMDFGAIAALK